jgi:CRISPR-associated protein, Cas1 family
MAVFAVACRDPSPPTLRSRLAQYQRAYSPWGLELAKRIVRGKIRNQRALLQLRNRATRGQIAPLQEHDSSQ